MTTRTKTHYAYIYRDPTNNDEPFYVGKGTGYRCNAHLSPGGTRYVYERVLAIRQRGSEPIVEVVKALDEDHAYFLEETLVDFFGRISAGTGPLLNIVGGGRGSPAVPPSTSAKIKRALTGRPCTQTTRNAISTALTGKSKGVGRKRKPCSTTTLANMRAAQSTAPKPVVTCPHCAKQGGGPIMKRYHFDRCKQRR